MSAALAGKVALVTGAARGIGRATARKLAAEGCDVAVNYYNSADAAESLCAEIRALGRRAVAIQASVGMPDSVDEMFAELRKHFERLDIVVSQRRERRAEAHDRDDAQALALVPRDQCARAQPARPARSAA